VPVRTKKPEREPPFVIRRSGIHGRGAFATRRIRKGERIVEYVGERITWAEADRRYDVEAMKTHHTFLFALSGRSVIDAAVGGNDSRYINHSCEPNCEAIEVDGRVFIEALKTIEVGDELHYDYAFARDATMDEEEALYPCHCGAPGCRGTLLEAPTRRPKSKHHVAARQSHVHRTAGQGRRGTRPQPRRS
jgi:hypothetical protein